MCLNARASNDGVRVPARAILYARAERYAYECVATLLYTSIERTQVRVRQTQRYLVTRE